MLSKWMDLAVGISLDAVKTIRIDKGSVKEIDIKRYCRIEKIPGGTIEDCKVVKGVILNKVGAFFYSMDRFRMLPMPRCAVELRILVLSFLIATLSTKKENLKLAWKLLVRRTLAKSSNK